jgi:hypothetical protein
MWEQSCIVGVDLLFGQLRRGLGQRAGAESNPNLGTVFAVMSQPDLDVGDSVLS